MSAYQALALGHFLRGGYDEAAKAARRAMHSNPNLSVSHGLLAAMLAKLGRIEEARGMAPQVLALDPSFSASRCRDSVLPSGFRSCWPNFSLTLGPKPACLPSCCVERLRVRFACSGTLHS
jgi:tetratricopeptide (TPR) repeat protein